MKENILEQIVFYFLSLGLKVRQVAKYTATNLFIKLLLNNIPLIDESCGNRVIKSS